MIYENFISYKRKESSFETKSIYDGLSKSGLSTFCDVYELGSCNFTTEILDIIKTCTNFILVISDNIFDNIKDPNDWIYKELKTAIEYQKNIICVFLSEKYVFPSNLPDDIKKITEYNGIYYSKFYFDSFMNKLLKKFIVSKEEISISSELSDFIIDGSKLIKYVGHSKTVNIPENISEIGDYAFKDCTFIEKIQFPNNLKIIGEHSFERCLNLLFLVFNDHLITIKAHAFSRCFNVSYIQFNSEIKTIEDQAFSFCNKIKYIKLPKSLQLIASSAFNNCPKLSSIIVESGNEHYCDSNGILYSKDCSTLIRCPEGLNSDSIVVDEQAKEIADYAFYKCLSIQNIVLHHIEKINAYAFAYCTSISKIQLPSTISSFSLDAIEGWSSEQKIIFAQNMNPALKSEIEKRLKSTTTQNQKNSENQFILVKTAFESYEEAEKLCTILIEKHYIVSGQIIKIHSLYSWNNEMCSEDEYELTCFTDLKTFKTLSSFIKENHSYEVCELIAIPILATSEEFSDWISSYLS